MKSLDCDPLGLDPLEHGIPVFVGGEPRVPRPSPPADTTSLPRAMEDFLAGIERRAFAIAFSLLRDRDEALDTVQDAMLALVRSYGHRPTEDWPPLFYRILNNRINDGFRRRKVRHRLFTWLTPADAIADTEDPWAQIPDPAPHTPPQQLDRQRQLQALETAVGTLPRRQREAFILRCWEGLSTEETARTMGCTQGSVKTHYFRALQTLRAALEEFQP